MKAVVVYDSVFGNTEKIARAIADGLATRAEVKLVHSGADAAVPPSDMGLLVVGSPTRGFRPTESLAAWLKGLRSSLPRGVKVAAFDTRFKADEIESAGVRFVVRTGGYAAKRIADRLKSAGGTVIAPPEGFYVEDTEGPLKPGEEDRATAWGKSLVAIVAGE